MNAADLRRYKRLLFAKLDELSATRGGARTLVLGAGVWQGDLVDQANSDAEAELQVAVRHSDARLLRAMTKPWLGSGEAHSVCVRRAGNLSRKPD